jgi:tetratricopeptide (TPR) repeat protein
VSHDSLGRMTWQLVAALGDEHGEDLLHLLTCPECRDAAAAVLRAGGGLAGALVPNYDPVFRRLEAGNVFLLEEARRRRGEAGRLVAELRTLPPKQRRKIAEQERFEREDVQELLLLESEAVLEDDPQEAVSLGRLADSLARRLAWDDSTQGAVARARAQVLTAGAYRLAGDFSRADTLLRLAIPYLMDASVRGAYCRTLALLRWEEGNIEEAIALFQRGTEILGEEELAEEAALCVVPLGLLYLEQGATGRALELLLPMKLLDPSARRGLAVRAALGLALALAELQMPADARVALQGAYRLYDQIRQPLDQVRLYWIESRVLARLGEPEQALILVEQVLAKLLAEKLVPEAALAAVEMMGLLASLGRTGEIPDRLAVPRDLCARDWGLRRATSTLNRLAAAAAAGDQALPQRAQRYTYALRQTLRLGYHRVEPPPAA